MKNLSYKVQMESLAGPEAVLQNQQSQTSPSQQERRGMRKRADAEADSVPDATAPSTGEPSCAWVSLDNS